MDTGICKDILPTKPYLCQRRYFRNAPSVFFLMRNGVKVNENENENTSKNCVKFDLKKLGEEISHNHSKWANYACSDSVDQFEHTHSALKSCKYK